MRIILFLVLLPFLHACGGGSGISNVETPVARETPTPTPLPNNIVETTRFYGTSALTFGRLYRSEDFDGALPVVVMIHGGCWQGIYGEDLMTELALALAARGFAVWNIDYRSLGTEGQWPVMFQDVSAAVDFLAEISEEYELDTTQILAMGHSAGGHLALWLGSRSVVPSDSDLYDDTILPIQGVLSLAGIPDLTASTSCGALAWDILDFFEVDTIEYERRLRAASPVELLPSGTPSILISGERDFIVQATLGEAYSETASSLGDISEHIVIEDADHFLLIDADRISINLYEDSLRRLLTY